MSLIDVKNLTFSHDGGYKNVFENASFSIDTEWKTGFIGRNGRGKTTFLDLLAGKYPYTGKITTGATFVRFPFPVADQSSTVREILREICPDAEDWQIEREFNALNLKEEISGCAFCDLSGGEQTKALLAGLFLVEDGYLLIDEPTNHLDGEARRAVARYLKRKRGFLLVSHDREFLDGCTDHILSISRANIEVCAGNFSVWQENFERRQAFERARHEKLGKEVKRLSEAAARTSVWAEKAEDAKYGKAASGLKKDKGYVGHKAAKVMKRAKSAEGRANSALEEKRELLRNAETEEALKLFPLDARTERLVAFSDVGISYGGKEVCGPIDFDILRGERVALCGGNGSGKSSILKLIAGEKIAHSGAVILASGLVVSYIPQSVDGICGTLGDFAREHSLDEPLFRAILDKTGFEKEDFAGDISRFSQGQKKKVLLAKSLCERAHLYVWDEPFNYIDLYARMQIEKLLCTFRPTMVFAEHDGAFRKAVATRELVLENR